MNFFTYTNLLGGDTQVHIVGLYYFCLTIVLLIKWLLIVLHPPRRHSVVYWVCPKIFFSNSYCIAQGSTDETSEILLKEIFKKLLWTGQSSKNRGLCELGLPFPLTLTIWHSLLQGSIEPYFHSSALTSLLNFRKVWSSYLPTISPGEYTNTSEYTNHLPVNTPYLHWTFSTCSSRCTLLSSPTVLCFLQLWDIPPYCLPWSSFFLIYRSESMILFSQLPQHYGYEMSRLCMWMSSLLESDPFDSRDHARFIL